MYHELLRDATFWSFLCAVDKSLAEDERAKHCPACGGRLHCADFPRKPRGYRNLPAEYEWRLSFCCAQDGCRKRVTPPSVRFLGRKVYLNAVVILVAAMRQGPSPRRVRELTDWFGCSRDTIYRWREFWNEHFPQTTFWKLARARLVPAVTVVDFPRSIVEAFLRGRSDHDDWSKLLRFLSPISVAKGLVIRVSEDGEKPAEDADRQA
jgi:hypothetical protein